jgi:hypothetical protein
LIRHFYSKVIFNYSPFVLDATGLSHGKMCRRAKIKIRGTALRHHYARFPLQNLLKKPGDFLNWATGVICAG